MEVRIELYHDRDVDRWGFRVPALAVNGSGDTRADAERRAIEVISEVLAGSAGDFDADAEAVTLRLEPLAS